MSFELDHFFVLTEPGAPAAELLIDLGMIEGTANTHPGQGTASRRFFSQDAMLELAYISDAQEAAAGPGARLRIVERANDDTASPFGLILRGSDESDDVPFPGWRYYPDYLDGEQYFHIGENSDLIEEPLCVYVPFSYPEPTRPSPTTPFGSVTEVRISLPSKRASSVLEKISLIERVSLISGEPHLMEVVFDEQQERQDRDLRPTLPLVIRW